MSDDSNLSEQPFVSHLIELRDRLLRMVLAVVVLLLILFPFGNDIFHVLAQPVMNALPEGNSMVATKVLSPFLTPLKLAFVAAVFIAMPYLLYQLWSFIAPGLYQHEKRLAFPLLASSIVLFYVGATFAYFVVLPLLFPFLVGVTPDDVMVMPDIADFLDIAIRFFFAFGMAFEVPVATILLVMAGISTPQSLAEKRPYVIVGSFVIGMLLTPPDIISQTLLAVPMWLLFEVGLLLSKMLLRKRRQRGEQGTESTADTPPFVGTMPVAAGAASAGVASATPSAPSPSGAPAAASESSGESLDDESSETMTEQQMEDEFDRIEAEFEALNETPAEGVPDVDADDYDESEDNEAVNGVDELVTSSADDDAANMLDEEETFPQRSATEALVDAKIEQIAALYATEAYSEARRLLYEVLEDGNEQQKKVARNILGQLDS